MLDERLITALHVRALRAGELHAESEPHVLFQASTIGALLDGAYDGDVSFADLRDHGDLGLGTLNGLDGEMIALEGEFMRADVDGAIHPVADSDLTPFAVVTWFDPGFEWVAAEAIGQPQLAEGIDRRVAPDRACAIRVDGSFERGARPVGPAPAAALPPVGRGGRRPARVHPRRRGGDPGRFPLSRRSATAWRSRLSPALRHRRPLPRRARARLRRRPGGEGAARRLREMHLELPPGVDLYSPELAAEAKAAIDRVERAG